MRDEIFEAYLSFLERAQGLSESSLERHRCYVGAFLKDLRRQGCFAWKQLTPPHVDSFTRRCCRHYQRVHLANVLGVIRKFLRYLHFRGVIERPLHSLVLTPRIFRFERLPRFLKPPEVERLFNSIDRSRALGRRTYVTAMLMVSTGLRAGELVRLTLDDVDWKGRLLRVRPGKTRSGRVVPIPEPASQTLAEYVQRDRPAGAPSRHLFWCLGKRHRPLTVNSLSADLRRQLDKAGLSVRSACHGLRHTFAQHLLEQGIGYPALQALLGHQSLRTVGFYARVQFGQLREVADNYAEEL